MYRQLSCLYEGRAGGEQIRDEGVTEGMEICDASVVSYGLSAFVRSFRIISHVFRRVRARVAHLHVAFAAI